VREVWTTITLAYQSSTKLQSTARMKNRNLLKHKSMRRRREMMRLWKMENGKMMKSMTFQMMKLQAKRTVSSWR
jgi:hypothetical protein